MFVPAFITKTLEDLQDLEINEVLPENSTQEEDSVEEGKKK